MQPLKIFNSFNLASTFVSESNHCKEEDFVQEICMKHLQQHHIIISVIVVVVINIIIAAVDFVVVILTLNEDKGDVNGRCRR